MTKHTIKAADYGLQAAANFFRSHDLRAKATFTKAELAALMAIAYEAGAARRTRHAVETIKVDGAPAIHTPAR